MSIGEKITKLRKENNMTQEQLADLMQVSRQSVSRWESDVVFPETDKLLQLSNIFNCSVDYLLKNELLDKNATKLEVKEIGRKNRKLIITLFGMIIVILCLCISLLCALLYDDRGEKTPYEDAELLLEFEDLSKEGYSFNKSIVDNGMEIVVTYINDSVKIKYNDVFKIYSSQNDIIITCLDGFTYLNNGYYKNISEGEYEIIVVFTYIEDMIVDICSSVKRVNTAYDNISMHIIDKHGNEDIINLTYLGEFNQCIGQSNIITLVYQKHDISWSTNNEYHNVSLDDCFYFVADGKILDVVFGKVISEIYTDYFKFDSDSGYIINNIGEFRDREFYLFFENGNIYFDLSY